MIIIKGVNPISRLLLIKLAIALAFLGIIACGNSTDPKKPNPDVVKENSMVQENTEPDKSSTVPALLVSPQNPMPGETFRVMAVGHKDIRKSQIVVTSPSGVVEPKKTRNGDGLPYWKIEEFRAGSEGTYKILLKVEGKVIVDQEFSVLAKTPVTASTGVWKTIRGWDGETEELYSAWINALFYDADERASWGALHEVTQNPERNFLFNHFSLGEDDPNNKNKVLMEPDCADNPFYLRAYFSWKLGLPFGYHVCDRGTLGRAPQTGQWVTNETSIQRSTPTQKMNTFLRMVANGVHSGTARTALENENADYYPVPLTQEGLRPGVVFADPYGHTLILVKRIAQTNDKPGVLLSVDAQPDGTVGIKRFWKGNFLFTTSEVIGEPGFKAFRPIILKDGQPQLLKNEEINSKSGVIQYALQQKKMTGEVFYHTMERIINPKPLDPEVALLDLVEALYEQLTVRITSVGNGEAYMKSHPGTVIEMPGRPSGVFQAGGQWEDFSTPNRDLRLLIAMDAILDFPDKIVRSPEDFKIPMLQSPEKVKKNLEELLNNKLSELSITYIRTNGSEQNLTLSEILKRRAEFEMAYNPNDGIEIRWGAPEGSDERSSCKRHVPANQMEKMKAVRVWFQKRLHPPT